MLLRNLCAAACAASVAVALGCAHTEPHGMAPGPGGALPFDAAAIVAAADWKQMVDVRMEMVDYGYRPRELRLRTGQPYRLRLVNVSSFDHYFTAPDFLRAVATRKAMVEHFAEVKGPYFTAFEVFKRGGTIDLYFVPVLKGSYTAYCTLEDHRERGVSGTVIIE